MSGARRRSQLDAADAMVAGRITYGASDTEIEKALAAPADADAFAPIMVCLADVRAEPVEWLWEQRLAMGPRPVKEIEEEATFAGPIVIATASVLRGVAILPHGADDGTTVEVK